MKYVAMVLLTGLLLLNGCSDFATQYDRVDTGELRLLDMQFEPAEAAPGDTVTVKAIFAGRQVLQSDARWRISYSVVTNYYGVDTAYDIQPFQPEYIPSAFSDQTSCLAFKIIVPRDMMIKNSSLSQDWVKDIPNTYAMFIPTDVRSLLIFPIRRILVVSN